MICFVYMTVVVAAIVGPSKFFSSASREGVSLLRDDQELSIYFDRTAFFREGTPPYRNFRIEYPLLGVAYLVAPYFFSTHALDAYLSDLTVANMLLLFQSYRANLMIINMLALFVLIVVTYCSFPPDRRYGMQWWLFLLPSVVYYVINRFDIWPAVLVQLSLLLLFRQRFTGAFLFLSAAFLAKGYAIVLFPVFLMYYLNKKHKELSPFTNSPLLIMAIPTVLAIGAACLWSGLENGLFPYIFQSTRTFAYGSAFIMYLGAFSTTLPAWLWSGGVALLGYGLTFLQLLLPIIIYCGHMIFRKWIKDREDVINWSLLGLLIYIHFSVYYSPQWILWVLPLFVFFIRTKREVLILVAYDIMNYVQCPLTWNAAGPQSVPFSMMVIIRSILLVVLIWLVGRRIWLKHISNHQNINREYAAIN